MELIYIETEVFALILWDILPTHRRLLEFHHKNHTEKVSIDVTQAPLRKVHEENLFVVHDFADIEARFNLTKSISHDGIRLHIKTVKVDR